jgi:phosphoglucosamine mutase
VISIGVEPNGRNINDGCGATAPAALVAKVKEHQADLGIALDCYAHGLQMDDSTGRLFNGDDLLYVLAKDRVDRGLKLGGVVGTLMTNAAIEQAIKALGLQFERANVGDRYVLEQLKKHQWTLGGEGSGHLLCLDQHSTGDGTVAALQVLAAMRKQGKSLAELLHGVNVFPQVLLNVKVAPGYDWQADTKVVEVVNSITAQLGTAGRVLIRASGTEPVLRVMVEAKDQQQATGSAKTIVAAIPTSH